MAYCRHFLCTVQLYLTFLHCKGFHLQRALNLLNMFFPNQTVCIFCLSKISPVIIMCIQNIKALLFFRFSVSYLTEISMPTSTSTKRMTEKLHEKIVYEYLKLVALKFLKNVKKSALKDGNIQEKEIEVCSRKLIY